MSKNIFSISDWASGTSYSKNDIVYFDGYFYYATANHVSGITFTQDLQGGYWSGVMTDFDGTERPFFNWKPSYASSVDSNPRVKSIKFGDGYEQRVQDGINNILIELDLGFDQLDINEYTAILHFLYSRRGTESFLFIPPQPYDNLKRFVSRTWNGAFNSYNNYSIKTRFEEVMV